MTKAIVSDFSRVLLFLRKEDPSVKLNDFHEKKLESGNYDFWHFFRLNEELLEFYCQLSKDLPLYIFTTRYIQEYPPVKEKLDPIFTEIFSARRLGVGKDEPAAYQLISSKIDCQPSDILYLDDKLANINAAKAVGFQVHRYRNNQELRNFIKNQKYYLI